MPPTESPGGGGWWRPPSSSTLPVSTGGGWGTRMAGSCPGQSSVCRAKLGLTGEEELYIQNKAHIAALSKIYSFTFKNFCFHWLKLPSVFSSCSNVDLSFRCSFDLFTKCRAPWTAGFFSHLQQTKEKTHFYSTTSRYRPSLSLSFCFVSFLSVKIVKSTFPTNLFSQLKRNWDVRCFLTTQRSSGHATRNNTELKKKLGTKPTARNAKATKSLWRCGRLCFYPNYNHPYPPSPCEGILNVFF